MNLLELIKHAGDIADESISISSGTNYVNDAIAKINVRAKANFPFMNADLPEGEFSFNETWQRTLLVPFVVGRIKTKDSSQFEYTDMYNEFLDALDNFNTQYNIPEEYKDHSGEVFNPVTQKWEKLTSDIYTNRPFGWMGW